MRYTKEQKKTEAGMRIAVHNSFLTCQLQPFPLISSLLKANIGSRILSLALTINISALSDWLFPSFSTRGITNAIATSQPHTFPVPLKSRFETERNTTDLHSTPTFPIASVHHQDEKFGPSKAQNGIPIHAIHGPRLTAVNFFSYIIYPF